MPFFKSIRKTFCSRIKHMC